MKNSYTQTERKKSLFFLILSCSGGAGHNRAAEALHRTAPLTGLPIRTEHYDVLDFTTKLFKKLYSESYIQMVNRAPELWGYLFERSEKQPYNKKGIIQSFDHFNYKRYVKILKEKKPDAVICTHFLPYISISNELQKLGISIPFYAVTTDFDIHQLWVDPIIKNYFVFHEESAWQLQAKNIPSEQITVAGIPVMPEFSVKQKPRAIRRQLGLETQRFTILLLSGGFGMGRMKEIVQHTLTALQRFPTKKFTLLVVCGKNEKARIQIASLHYPATVTSQVFGFVNNIHELMDASNVVISKAGGLTSSEAMAKGLPMIIVDPIPGQESRNADIIVEHGAGWKAINLANLGYKLQRIISIPSLLTQAQKATLSLSKPHAASDILKYVYLQVSDTKE